MDAELLKKIQELANTVDEKYQQITFETLLKHNLPVKSDQNSDSKEVNPENKSANGSTFNSKELDNISLKDIMLKDLPKSEAEWLLIYAYTITLNGTDFFKREDLIELYEQSKRKTDSRINNLSNNIKRLVKRGYFKFINETDTMVTDAGIEVIQEILER